MRDSLSTHPWWDYVHEDLRELLIQSSLLIDIFTQKKESQKLDEKNKFHDWAFIVFPAAKAYEGYLKTLFRDLKFISDEDFYGKRFRIGRALNPELDRNFREKESVYDRLVNYCKGPKLADTLWETWKRGRNLLFHWFPNERNAISFSEAKDMVDRILSTMDLAFESCKLEA